MAVMAAFEALVAALGAGAVDGLLQGIGGQDAERDGDAGFAGRLGQALGGFAGDVVEVRRFAADDGAQADDARRGVSGAASSAATTGISQEPGTLTISMSSSARRRAAERPAPRRAAVR